MHTISGHASISASGAAWLRSACCVLPGCFACTYAHSCLERKPINICFDCTLWESVQELACLDLETALTQIQPMLWSC